tara:strand:+ start:1026 stop:1346 length:321 start_codon:yes stop_codon:yes gene_type:complete
MNIQKMMKQAQEMQTKLATMQEELDQRETEGSAGGGMVKVVVTGKGTLAKLDVDPSLIDPEEKEVMEDLIIAAYNDAKGKADSMYEEEMGKMAGGLGLPAGMKLPF